MDFGFLSTSPSGSSVSRSLRPLGSFLSLRPFLIVACGIVCQAIFCMSDRVTISSQDISDLVSALQELTVVVTRIARSAELSRASATQASFAEQEGWEIVEDEYHTSDLLNKEETTASWTFEASPFLLLRLGETPVDWCFYWCCSSCGQGFLSRSQGKRSFACG